MMKQRLLPIILMSILLSHFSAVAAGDVCVGPPLKVMLTAFEPFGGRRVNASMVIGDVLARLPSGDPCLQYEVCVVPVEYEQGFKTAVECYEKSQPKPAMVISMGEGDCTLRLETKAHNLNDTPYLPDNAGNVRANSVIERDSPENELLTLPVADMYCTSQIALGPPAHPSISPGYYVCNDIAYRMARFLKPKQVPFGFIHVPTAEYCNVDAMESARKVDVMVHAAIRTLSVPTTVFTDKFGSFSNCSTYRTSHLPPLLGVVKAGCRAQVINQIRLQTRRAQETTRSRGDISGPGSQAK